MRRTYNSIQAVYMSTEKSKEFFSFTLIFRDISFHHFWIDFFSAIGMQRITTPNWNVNLLLEKCGVCTFAR